MSIKPFVKDIIHFRYVNRMNALHIEELKATKRNTDEEKHRNEKTKHRIDGVKYFDAGILLSGWVMLNIYAIYESRKVRRNKLTEFFEDVDYEDVTNMKSLGMGDINN